MSFWQRLLGRRAPDEVTLRIDAARAGKGSQLVLDGSEPLRDLRVALQYPDGRPIPGFEISDSRPVTTSVAGEVRVEWEAAANKESMQTGLVDLSRFNGVSVDVVMRGLGKVRVARIEPGRELALPVGPGPHLFLDDLLVAETDNLERVTHAPRRLEGPIMTERPEELLAPGTVLPASTGEGFRHWIWRAGQRHRTELLLHESERLDRWPGVPRQVGVFDGFGASLLDDGPNCADPKRRLKLLYFRYTPAPMGICAAFSPDGEHWVEPSGNPVLPFYPHTSGRWAEGVGDIVDPYHAPGGGYSAFVKLHSATDEELGLQSRTVRAGLGVRLLGLTHSPDFIHWSKPRRLFLPDRRDEGVTEFYGAESLRRGDQMIGFLRVLRDDLAAEPGGPVEGIGYTTLITSRDGVAWQRHRDVFLDRASDPGRADRAFAWVYSAVEHDDRVWLFYAAYDEGHKVGHRRVRLAVTDKDRFVSRSAPGGSSGRLVTRLLRCAGDTASGLWVNAAAAGGEIRVQLRDQEGHVPLGYAFDDCEPIRTDRGAQAVRFVGGSDHLRRGPFRLEFALQSADLFGFSFTDSV